jgi:hypothetical protein
MSDTPNPYDITATIAALVPAGLDALTELIAAHREHQHICYQHGTRAQAAHHDVLRAAEAKLVPWLVKASRDVASARARWSAEKNLVPRLIASGSACLVATFYPVLVDDASDDHPITVLMRLSDQTVVTINNGPMLDDAHFERIKGAMMQLMREPDLMQVELDGMGTVDRLEA